MATRKLWGGRFQGNPGKILESFSESFSFDRKLWKEEIAVLKAHVAMLTNTKVLEPAIGAKLKNALGAIGAEIQSGKLAVEGNHEDIHSFVEAELENRVGKDASLIRLGRSRNDTVVTDFRLHLKSALQEIRDLHHRYLEAWISLAERLKGDVVPGYTHFRRAQAILFPFYCLSHFTSGKREREMLDLTMQWADVSTLGAGAISGTSWPIDPEMTAKELGFSSAFSNALDAVSDRDFLLAFYFTASLILTHMSRWCEDFILWSSEGIGYLELPDQLCTGSSLMPQKKNPDPLELLRGKSAAAIATLNALFVLLKGLPMGYNRDLQDDKDPAFYMIEMMKQSLAMAAEILKGVSINKENLCKLWKDDFVLATDLADELVKQGRSFADAHALTGKTVRYCDEKKKSLRELSTEEWKRLVPKFDPKTFMKLDIVASAKRRNSPGGTGEKSVAKALSEAKAWLRQKL